MSVHRICVLADRDGRPVAIDVALPSSAPVGQLLPAIVGMVDDRGEPDGAPRGWRLDRLSGGPLVESLSLSDNDIHDGELLVLASEQAAPLGLMRLEPCREVAAVRSSTQGLGRSLPEAVCVLATALAAVTLAWSGVGTHTPSNLIVAGIGLCAAAAATFASGHPTALGMATVALAAATGFLAVPSGAGAPNVLLAAAATFAAALLVLRMSGRPSPALTGIATFSVLLAMATVVAMPVAVVGAVLPTASLGLLSLAPRLAVRAAGLGPDHWIDEMQSRGAAGHATLTGLVAGCATGASAGAAVVAFAVLRSSESTHGAVAFSALVGLVMLLRARTYVEPAHQTLLVLAGFGCGMTSFATAAISYPDLVGWLGGGFIAIALLAGRRPRIGPGVSRSLDRLEYVALAAVVPVALWVGGAYTLVSVVHLP